MTTQEQALQVLSGAWQAAKRARKAAKNAKRHFGHCESKGRPVRMHGVRSGDAFVCDKCAKVVQR